MSAWHQAQHAKDVTKVLLSSVSKGTFEIGMSKLSIYIP